MIKIFKAEILVFQAVCLNSYVYNRIDGDLIVSEETKDSVKEIQTGIQFFKFPDHPKESSYVKILSKDNLYDSDEGCNEIINYCRTPEELIEFRKYLMGIKEAAYLRYNEYQYHWAISTPAHTLQAKQDKILKILHK